ncbi:MAG: hypothetical protein ACFFDF_04125 [Candidatus Odinarchaeota archaeon]
MNQKNSYMELMNPIFIKLKRNGKTIYDTLTKPKIVKISIYISLLTFLPGLILGLIIAIDYGSFGYSLWFNWISDLGSHVYTPAPFILDLTCIVSAIFIIPLILNLSRLYSAHQNNKLDNSKKEHYIILFRRIFGYLGVASLFIGVIGMFFVGVFSLDRSPFDLHFYFSTSAFGGFAFGAFFTGLAIVLRKRIFPKTVGWFMILGPSTASIIFLLCPAPLTRQFLEWILMFSSLAWYYVIVFITLQKLNTLLFFNPDFKW